MQKKISILWTVIICLIAVLITFELTFIFVTSNSKKNEQRLAQSYENYVNQLEERFNSINEMYNSLPEELRTTELFTKLSYVDTYYRTLYAGQIDEERLVYYVMNGYIQGVGDAYGEYYTANDLESLFNEAEGKMYGIGVNVTYNSEHDAIEVISVIEDSPAERAGIVAGDIILSVDGTRATSANYYTAINMVKGEKGTGVSLGVLRGTEQITITAIRDEIKIVTVTYRKYSLDQSIGVVKITEFNNTTTDQLKQAVNALVKDSCTSIVFDVRNNPGGTLDGVVGSLDFLLPEGSICHIRNGKGELVQTHTSDSTCLDPSIKLAVLINENTASAAELFASALRDYNRATLVGVTTFGKGTMQTTYMLPDGAGIKLSTNYYNPPCDVNYDKEGVSPHKQVELDEAVKDKNLFKLTDSEYNQLLDACRELGYNN